MFKSSAATGRTYPAGEALKAPDLVRPTRRSFLTRSAFMTAAGGSVVLLGGGMALGQETPRQEAREARRAQGRRGPERGQFESIQQHENDHVAFLVKGLGASARPKPTFKGLAQANFDDFVALSQTLENTGVGAYLGAAPFLSSTVFLSAAASIATIEARHAGFLNDFLGDPITGNTANDDVGPSFDPSLTADQVVAAAGGFIADLNGGPPVGYAQTASPDNDVAILNFALALEYLEAEFYNLNVPKFYRPRK